MSVFHFKKFDVVNERSALKVNTDAVLLGALTPLPGETRSILDIGTGTGVIALMLAQRVCESADTASTDTSENTSLKTIRITGIDIDKDAADEAGENFTKSKWSKVLHAENQSLEEWRNSNADLKFDIIVSNPPYFDSSLTNPEARKATARHTGEDESGLSYREIMDYSQTALSPNGRLSIILPADQEAAMLRYGRMCGLHPNSIVRVRTVERKKPSRIVVTFSRDSAQTEETMLTIMNQGKYTDEYISLVKEFYLFA